MVMISVVVSKGVVLLSGGSLVVGMGVGEALVAVSEVVSSSVDALVVDSSSGAVVVSKLVSVVDGSSFVVVICVSVVVGMSVAVSGAVVVGIVVVVIIVVVVGTAVVVAVVVGMAVVVVGKGGRTLSPCATVHGWRAGSVLSVSARGVVSDPETVTEAVVSTKTKIIVAEEIGDRGSELSRVINVKGHVHAPLAANAVRPHLEA